MSRCHNPPIALLVVTLAALTACRAGEQSAFSLRSNAYVARAGTGGTRAGFGAGALLGLEDDEKYLSLPVVQGMAGVDLGPHYAVHANVNSRALWVDGTWIPLSEPRWRLGIAHGVAMNYTGWEDTHQIGAALGLGPYVVFGEESPLFVATRYDVGTFLQDQGSVHTAGGSVGWNVGNNPHAILELLVARDVTSDVSIHPLYFGLGLTLSAEVRR